MLYDRIEPELSLTNLIDCYWVIESNDRTPRQQKIIPDGFPEIIFHYRDPYRIKLSGEWELQTKKLFAGQIRNHFLLENTGSSGMIGIKFKPAGLTKLFGIDMQNYTDNVADLDSVLESEFHFVSEILLSPTPYFEKVDVLNQFFTKKKAGNTKSSQIIEQTLELISENNGVISVSELTSTLDVGERKLERLFNKYVGLSPKFYSRIIRFNYIFQVIQKKKLSWSEVAHLSGYYDQSHFISNFQEFTGEDPSSYFFENDNMANFFLKRPIEN
ncbi:MAG: helix-turn-helix transcriptional regulator [Balneolaceae bacterium]|nr:helix-turn-helix transcriptional regulator [Balneolaceae bacterium]MBO6544906.1 helix-turn-helix transcriptional regulator [Balneolaceae bacterium]MBO6646302.1 helix-turn-helix transcriptional regulator [Balneolaceae bacterium]